MAGNIIHRGGGMDNQEFNAVLGKVHALLQAESMRNPGQVSLLDAHVEFRPLGEGARLSARSMKSQANKTRRMAGFVVKP